MNLNELQRKLIAAARATPPSEQVPYAFEQRVLARLRKPPVSDEWALWARALWRSAAPCVALMMLLCAWSVLTSGNHSPATDLSQEIENTVFAAADTESAAESLW